MKSSTELDSEKLMLSTSPDIIGFGLSEAELSVGARQIFSDSLLQYKTDIFNNHPDSREKCGESFRHTQSESEENEEEERDTKKPLLPKITNVRQSRYFSIQPASDIPSTPRWIKHRTSTSEAMPAQSTMNENLHELVVGLEEDSTLHNRSGAGPSKLATEQTQLHETGTGPPQPTKAVRMASRIVTIGPAPPDALKTNTTSPSSSTPEICSPSSSLSYPPRAVRLLIPTRNPLVTAKSAEEDEQRYTGANTGEQSDRAKTSTATTFSSERDMLEKRNKELKHDYLEHKTKKNKGYMSEKEVEGGGPAISSQGAGDVVSSSGSIHDNALVGDCRPDFETDHPQVSRQEMMPSNWPLALSEIDQLDTLVEAGSEAFQARAPLADKKNW